MIFLKSKDTLQGTHRSFHFPMGFSGGNAPKVNTQNRGFGYQEIIKKKNTKSLENTIRETTLGREAKHTTKLTCRLASKVIHVSATQKVWGWGQGYRHIYRTSLFDRLKTSEGMFPPSIARTKVRNAIHVHFTRCHILPVSSVVVTVGHHIP